MKNTTTLLLILLFNTACMAQGVFSNQTNHTLEKVVQDYPGKFSNIKGELRSSAPGIAEYKSNIAIPGAISTTIIQSAPQQVCWQSVLYSGNDFNTARNRFEEFFNQIKNTIIKPQGEKAVIVNGLFINPSPDKTNTSIPFDLLPASGIMQNLHIDLALKNANGQWQIMLSVYDKDRQPIKAIAVK